MPCEPDETSVSALCNEALLQRRCRETKGHIHARATLRLCPATIKTLGVIDRSIQAGGFLAVASLSRRKAALCQQVLGDQASYINGKHRWRVQQRVVRCHLRLAHGGWCVGAAALQEVATDQHHGYPRWSQVFLRSGVDQTVIRQVHLTAQQI